MSRNKKQKKSRKLPHAEETGSPERAIEQHVLHDDIGYIYDPMYAKRHVGRRIFADALPEDSPRARKDLAWLTREVLPNMDAPPPKKPLTAKEEVMLFRQLNFCRYKITRLRQRLERGGRKEELLRKMVLLQKVALKVRNRIVEANMPLVISMAKRSRHDNTDFSDLISEGNVALLRAVDKFDCARGFKFSTYACRAILKSFTRMSLKTSRYRSRFPTEYDPALEKSDWTETQREELREGMLAELKTLLQNGESDLADVEQDVLKARFGLDGGGKPMTLEQVGRLIGVTKERVRQIQNKALAKLKESLEEVVFAASQ